MTRPHARPAGDPGFLPEEPPPARGRRRAVVIPMLLALAAIGTVGAAAYSRNAAANNAAERVADRAPIGMSAEALRLQSEVLSHDESVRGRSADAADAAAAGRPGGDKADVRSGAPWQPQTVQAAPGLQVTIGKLLVGNDDTGIRRTALPLTVTNLGSLTHSFDITIEAYDPTGARITDDTGTVANLRPGQRAEVRVLELVNNAFVGRLTDATFRVVDVFAY